MASFREVNGGAPRFGEGRSVALMGLALVAAGLFTLGAASPPGSPLRVVVPVTAAAETLAPASSICIDGDSGSFTRTIRHGVDGDFELQHAIGDGVRLCAQVRGPVRLDARTGAIAELPAGSSLLLETRAAAGRSQRMRVTREQGELAYEWSVNGAARPVDDAARAWLKDALEVVAAYREIGRIQGEVGSLQGQIGSIQGEIGSLQGQIGAIQGEIGSLQGEIGSIQGEQGSLQGEIGGHQGAIGGLQGTRWNASASRQQQIDKEIARHEAEIRTLEAKLESPELTKRLSDAEAELAAFEKSSRGRIEALERKIEAIRAEDRIGALEKQIENLHADDRIDEIKRRVGPAVERLKTQARTLGS